MSTSTSVHHLLTPQEAAERLARGEIDLVDVRDADEWQTGHAPGARHIPLAELASRLADVPRERPIAFVCRSGGRSEVATELARRQGVEALNVDGGLLAWQRAGLDLTNDAKETA